MPKVTSRKNGKSKGGYKSWKIFIENIISILGIVLQWRSGRRNNVIDSDGSERDGEEKERRRDRQLSIPSIWQIGSVL